MAIEFPKQLHSADLFPTPVWVTQVPEHVKKLNSFQINYLVDSKFVDTINRRT